MRVEFRKLVPTVDSMRCSVSMGMSYAGVTDRALVAGAHIAGKDRRSDSHRALQGLFEL